MTTKAAVEVTVRIVYEDARLAEIVCNSLGVDKEMRGDVVTRDLAVDAQGATLVARWAATDVKVLRTAVSAFFDMLGVANSALAAFA